MGDDIGILSKGLDPDGLYVFEAFGNITNQQAEKVRMKFSEFGLKNVMVVSGGRFITGESREKNHENAS